MTLVRLLALILLLWMPCRSESDWTLVTGVVTDKRGNQLPQAVVQLEDQATLFVRSYITDAEPIPFRRDKPGDRLHPEGAVWQALVQATSCEQI